MKKKLTLFIIICLIIGLSYSFWLSSAWMYLCYGLALFLFGMQCMEEGLNKAAGGYLKAILARSTASPARGLLFGMGATFVLQSSTLVSLLTIAFLSAGLIQLAGGIAIILGTNLGATSGIWLLAMAGQKFSLSPFALPILFFGVLGSFFNDKTKAYGRVLLGIGFLFLGIDAIKEGFSTFSDGFDFATIHVTGVREIGLFFLIGLIFTVLLQSTHATLMLALAALAGGQLSLEQSFAIAIGSNVGSSITTAAVGFFGSDRKGQRLALAHLLFNVITPGIALILFIPMVWLTHKLTGLIGFADNKLIQLAMFHTLLNLMGVALFWNWQGKLAQWIEKLLPDKIEEGVMIKEDTGKGHIFKKKKKDIISAQFLNDNALRSIDTTVIAVAKEMRHLAGLTLEVICHALYVPADLLYKKQVDKTQLDQLIQPLELDAEELYQRMIKGVYSDLFVFMSKTEQPSNHFLNNCQLVAYQLVEAVKDTKHLQKNMQQYLQEDNTIMHELYFQLRNHLFNVIHEIYLMGKNNLDAESWAVQIANIEEKRHYFANNFKQNLFRLIQENEITGWQMTSLLNDLGYVDKTTASLADLFNLTEDDGTEVVPYIIKLSSLKQ